MPKHKRPRTRLQVHDGETERGKTPEMNKRDTTNRETLEIHLEKNARKQNSPLKGQDQVLNLEKKRSEGNKDRTCKVKTQKKQGRNLQNEQQKTQILKTGSRPRTLKTVQDNI